MSSDDNTVLTEFHDRLLRLTLANALRTEFYRHRWEGLRAAEGRSGLAHLPIVCKSEIVAAGPRAQIRDGQRYQEKFTSGTSGTPFVNIVGEREQEALAELYNRIHEVRSAGV